LKARSQFLPFSPPDIGEAEIDEVSKTLRSDWITTGPKTKLFEEKFKAEVSAPAALALNSCTAGLHVALACLKIGPGDEVITTPMTFCATANVIEHVGARVILADVDPQTLLISPEKVYEKITKKTKAILPVHYAGHPADLDALEEMVEGKGIHIVEDAAHSLPSLYKGKPIGNRPHLTAFSFYATKNLTTAEGGMLTGPEEFIDSARVLALHGMDRDAWKRFDKAGSWRYDVVAPGFKYNMTDIQASLGLVQLTRLQGFDRRRKCVFDQYQRAFKDLAAIQCPVIRENVKSSYHLFVIQIEPDKLKINRDQFIEELKALNVGTSVHYIPIHQHSYYRNKYGFQPADFPVSTAAGDRMISLPLNSRLSDEDVNYVIEAVHDVCQRCVR
jgi:dTDP-4-amino-4,6-dideoxygalactose transaminase